MRDVYQILAILILSLLFIVPIVAMTAKLGTEIQQTISMIAFNNR